MKSDVSIWLNLGCVLLMKVAVWNWILNGFERQVWQKSFPEVRSIYFLIKWPPWARPCGARRAPWCPAIKGAPWCPRTAPWAKPWWGAAKPTKGAGKPKWPATGETTVRVKRGAERWPWLSPWPWPAINGAARWPPWAKPCGERRAPWCPATKGAAWCPATKGAPWCPRTAPWCPTTAPWCPRTAPWWPAMRGAWTDRITGATGMPGASPETVATRA